MTWKSAVDDFSAILHEDGDSWSASRSLLEFSTGASSEDMAHSTKNMVTLNVKGSHDNTSVTKKTVRWRTADEHATRYIDETSVRLYRDHRSMSPESPEKDEFSRSDVDSLESSLKGENLTLMSDGEQSIGRNPSHNKAHNAEIDYHCVRPRKEDSVLTNSFDGTDDYNYLSPDSSSYEAMDDTPSTTFANFGPPINGQEPVVRDIVIGAEAYFPGIERSCSDPCRIPRLHVNELNKVRIPPISRETREDVVADTMEEIQDAPDEPESGREWLFAASSDSSDAREDSLAEDFARPSEEAREQAPSATEDLAMDFSNSFDSDSPSSSERESQTDSETLESAAESILLGAEFDGILQDSLRSQRCRTGQEGTESHISSKLGARATFLGEFTDMPFVFGKPHCEVDEEDFATYPQELKDIEFDSDSLDAVADEVLHGTSPLNVLKQQSGVVPDMSRAVEELGKESTAPTAPFHNSKGDSGIQLSQRHSKVSPRKANQIRRLFSSKKAYNRYDTPKPATEDSIGSEEAAAGSIPSE